MLAKLGDFFFTFEENSFDTISERLKFNFAEHKKAQGHTEYEDVNREENDIYIRGKLILKPHNSLEHLKELGSSKKPLLLVFLSGYAYWVKVREMEIDYSRFVSGGKAIKREFNVHLTRVKYDDII